MDFCRRPWLATVTLFFFVLMLVFNPVHAQPAVTGDSGLIASLADSGLPVVYLSEREARRLAADLRTTGYAVREGSLAQLAQLTQTNTPADQTAAASGEQGCVNDKTSAAEKSAKATACTSKPVTGENGQVQQKLNEEVMGTESAPPAEPVSSPRPQPGSEPAPPPVEGHAYVGVQGNIAYSGGSGNRDFAKVFFIFAGIVMVAALVVYAGKYISDIVTSKEQTLWWELVGNSIFLDAGAGRHGTFLGAKLATGFVSDELIQLALVGEVGKTNLDLMLNEYTTPTPLEVSASYWMLGAAARLHLTDALVNASYLYLEMLGGSTSNRATDVIGAARLGVSFGIKDHWRLGASMGAQYIGLDEGQGFANDGDNYWLTYGVEVGARF